MCGWFYIQKQQNTKRKQKVAGGSTTERSTLVRHTSLIMYTIPPPQYKLEMALKTCGAIRLCIAIATRPVCLL